VRSTGQPVRPPRTLFSHYPRCLVVPGYYRGQNCNGPGAAWWQALTFGRLAGELRSDCTDPIA